MHSTSAHSGWQECSHPSLNHGMPRLLSLRIRISYNADKPGRMPVSPAHLPRWKAPALLIQKLLTDKSSQAAEPVLRKQSCRTILSQARQHGRGQAGEVRHEPTPARANSSPPRRVPVQFLGTHLSESPSRTKPQQGDGVWSPTQALGTGYASISSQSTHRLSVQWTPGPASCGIFARRNMLRVTSELCKGDAFTHQHYLWGHSKATYSTRKAQLLCRNSVCSR